MLGWVVGHSYLCMRHCCADLHTLCLKASRLERRPGYFLGGFIEEIGRGHCFTAHSISGYQKKIQKGKVSGKL